MAPAEEFFKVQKLGREDKARSIAERLAHLIRVQGAAPVKAPGRGGVINGQLKTLVKSSNIPLFEMMVLHVFVNSINPNSVTIDKLHQK